jgi:uncharacterized protein YraI
MRNAKIALSAALAGLMATAASADVLVGTAPAQLHIMKTPGSDAAVITEVPASTQFNVVGCTADGTWCKIDSSGATGWVRAGDVSVMSGGQSYVLSQAPKTVKVETIDKSNEDKGAAAGMVTGAAAGAIIGGPPGAAVGAVVGAIGGGTLAKPDKKVTTYVEANPTPAITYSGDLAEGQVLPETVTLTPVPGSDFSYVYVDNAPVIVDSHHRIVRVIR